MKTSSLRKVILLLGAAALVWALAGTPRYVVVEQDGRIVSVSTKSEWGEWLVVTGHHAQVDVGAGIMRTAGVLGGVLLLWLGAGYVGRGAPRVSDARDEAEYPSNHGRA